MTDTTLPPEVAEAIAALDAMTYAGSRTHAHWSCVKDHLHRLAEENARLKARIAAARRVMLGTYPADKRGHHVGRALAALDAETVDRAAEGYE